MPVRNPRLRAHRCRSLAESIPQSRDPETRRHTDMSTVPFVLIVRPDVSQSAVKQDGRERSAFVVRSLRYLLQAPGPHVSLQVLVKLQRLHDPRMPVCSRRSARYTPTDDASTNQPLSPLRLPARAAYDGPAADARARLALCSSTERPPLPIKLARLCLAGLAIGLVWAVLAGIIRNFLLVNVHNTLVRLSASMPRMQARNSCCRGPINRPPPRTNISAPTSKGELVPEQSKSRRLTASTRARQIHSWMWKSSALVRAWASLPVKHSQIQPTCIPCRAQGPLLSIHRDSESAFNPRSSESGHGLLRHNAEFTDALVASSDRRFPPHRAVTHSRWLVLQVNSATKASCASLSARESRRCRLRNPSHAEGPSGGNMRWRARGCLR
ncbi:hypothetical protein FA95DRAFT_1578777 [Auriscalpium vulgare]|uniref:Uncharacterized protein n=1 Tax=Auriscalpium vulgare TaxID=40419 RepID=A0ACB8R0A6_9AGAM|nr:hypothetical protein FA95DRAFT_1578777 [Auriscalpium vulgare]